MQNRTFFENVLQVNNFTTIQEIAQYTIITLLKTFPF